MFQGDTSDIRQGCSPADKQRAKLPNYGHCIGGAGKSEVRKDSQGLGYPGRLARLF